MIEATEPVELQVKQDRQREREVDEVEEGGVRNAADRQVW